MYLIPEKENIQIALLKVLSICPTALTWLTRRISAWMLQLNLLPYLVNCCHVKCSAHRKFHETVFSLLKFGYI